MAAAIILTSMLTFSVSVSAATIFEAAEDLSPLDTVSYKAKNEGESVFYKITLDDSGSLYLFCDSASSSTDIMVYDQYGTAVSKWLYIPRNIGNDNPIELEKGTYYIRVSLDNIDDNFKNLYYSFNPDKNPTVKLTLTMKAGTKKTLGIVKSNYSGKISWKSTRTSVATVKNGVVTAKRFGTAKIRAYTDSGEYAEITVKVKK